MKAMVMIGAWAMATAALAHEPAFDPRAHRDFAGPANEVLVLGSPHLSELPEAFRTDSLGPLLDRLAAWKPDIVTIEGVSGPECEMLLRYEAEYEDAFDSYCWGLEPAEKATG